MERTTAARFVGAAALVWLGSACSLTRSLDQYEEGEPALSGCPTGFANCDEDPSNGCETDTLSSLEHCSACNTPCSFASGEVACLDGVCQLTACLAGSGDCNGSVDDGCETDTDTSTEHCGACGQACPPANAAAGTCAGGTCSFTCLSGFADCDTDALNGCEVDLGTDPEHCGTCVNACVGPAHAYGICQGGLSCSWACEDLFGDCDADETNGCETLLDSDPANCGACDVSCPAEFTCEVGVCSCTHHTDCDYGGGGKCLPSGAIKICECGGVQCGPSQVCLPGPLCGQN